MKKTLLASLGFATSLLAITQEQQVALDKIFAEQRAKIENQNLNPQSKNMALRLLEKQKQEIQSKSDEEIAEYLANGSVSAEAIKQDKKEDIRDEETLGGDDEPLIDENTLVRSDGWLGWAFGATGARISFFYGGNLGSANMIYGTIGPQYNFSNKGSSVFTQEGFSLSLPIGFGAINTGSGKNNFALPIALEAKYVLNSGFYRFGFSAGLRYTYSSQDIGDLHLIDFYAGLDLIYGLYIEAGYVFYSSQDVKVRNKTISADPLSGAITLNMGFRF